MAIFSFIFGFVLLVNIAVTFRGSDYWRYAAGRHNGSYTAEKEDGEQKKRWNQLIRQYMAVYLTATMSDWLQGPYVYALYADYGYSQHDIAVLFVAGFGSSMIFGSFVGGMADWAGRRAFVILFAAIYSASCLTKHFKCYWILLVGRLLGGIATSLLFSVFDAWLIRSHADAGLKSWIGKSFSWAAYGNSVVAILAGLVANFVATAYPMTDKSGHDFVFVGGYLNPFDLALVILAVCGLVAAANWEENYGDSIPSSTAAQQGRHAKWHEGLKNAYLATIRSTDILLCGLVSSLFEASMYIFVFMWTPELMGSKSEEAHASSDNGLPLGLIFSTFMVCCMIGSSLFSIQIETVKVERLAVAVLGTAAASMALIAISSSQTFTFAVMNLFEMTVGMYWPVMGTMKGTIVPETKRAAIYNLFRIPLNFIVLCSLLTDLTPTQSFAINAVMLTAATGMQVVIMKRREKMGVADDNETKNLLQAMVASSPEKGSADAATSNV